MYGIFSWQGLGVKSILLSAPIDILILLFFVAFFICFEWIYRDKEYGFQISRSNRMVTWPMYLIIFSSCLLFGGSGSDFIYFQF
jgi:hypothetical protein